MSGRRTTAGASGAGSAEARPAAATPALRERGARRTRRSPRRMPEPTQSHGARADGTRRRRRLRRATARAASHATKRAGPCWWAHLPRAGERLGGRLVLVEARVDRRRAGRRDMHARTGLLARAPSWQRAHAASGTSGTVAPRRTGGLDAHLRVARQRTARSPSTNVTPSAPPWAVWHAGQPSAPRAASARCAGRVDGCAPWHVTQPAPVAGTFGRSPWHAAHVTPAAAWGLASGPGAPVAGCRRAPALRSTTATTAASAAMPSARPRATSLVASARARHRAPRHERRRAPPGAATVTATAATCTGTHAAEDRLQHPLRPDRAPLDHEAHQVVQAVQRGRPRARARARRARAGALSSSRSARPARDHRERPERSARVRREPPRVDRLRGLAPARQRAERAVVELARARREVLRQQRPPLDARQRRRHETVGERRRDPGRAGHGERHEQRPRGVRRACAPRVRRDDPDRQRAESHVRDRVRPQPAREARQDARRQVVASPLRPASWRPAPRRATPAERRRVATTHRAGKMPVGIRASRAGRTPRAAATGRAVTHGHAARARGRACAAARAADRPAHLGDRRDAARSARWRRPGTRSRTPGRSGRRGTGRTSRRRRPTGRPAGCLPVFAGRGAICTLPHGHAVAHRPQPTQSSSRTKTLAVRVPADGAGRAVDHAGGVLAVLAAPRDDERARAAVDRVAHGDLLAPPHQARHPVAVRVRAARTRSGRSGRTPRRR